MKQNKVGILGATPLDTGYTHAKDVVQGMHYDEVVCFGLDSGLDEIRRASECSVIHVIAPSGLKAAKLLHERFGTPYVILPHVPGEVLAQCREAGIGDKRILIVHQQFAANHLRDTLRPQEDDLPWPTQIDCAAWFRFDPAYAEENDFRIKTEQDLRDAAGSYDIIVGDSMFRRAVPDFRGEWISWPHYAVSGSAMW